MLYETLSQPQIFLWIILAGFAAGLLFDVAKFFHALCDFNKCVGHILDFVCTLAVCFVFFLLITFVSFGEFRVWQILCFLAAFFLERFGVGKFVAKGLDVCYNALTKKSKK